MNDIESTFRNLTRNLLAERLLEPELTEERCELIFSALMEMLVQVLVPIYTKFLLGFPDSVHVLSRKMSALPSKGVGGLPLSVCPHRGGRGKGHRTSSTGDADVGEGESKIPKILWKPSRSARGNVPE